MFIHHITRGLISQTWRNADDLSRLLQLDARIEPSRPEDQRRDRWPTQNAATNARTVCSALPWRATAEAGGVTMPADIRGVVAIDEFVLHGWDLARATGKPFQADPADVQASLGFAASMSEPGQEAGREGLYGPVVAVPSDTPALDRLLGFAGRDPHWIPDQG
jgi:uncharacterized protein (TIGR03086 family)